MLDNGAAQLGQVAYDFRPQIITDKVAISVIGLGYVGAVSCGCLADLGHKVVGVDVDPTKVDAIARGETPIHEALLGDLLADGVANDFIDATQDIRDAVARTHVTFVSVGTPTAPDGGCDYTFIEQVAREIGNAIAGKNEFHTIVLRCSVPPGTTMDVLGRIVAETSEKILGVDFGLAFVPEFLREGVAVADFRNPPKTVIGASDERTTAIVSKIFAPVDPAPIVTEIETAELVKYVDNVWHAAKVCFANEVGRLSKSMGVDGRAVMDIFCQDTKLNLSPYYLKPGFAFGGSCLPKEVRAVNYLAGRNNVDLPMISSLTRSNEIQINEALNMVRATGARKVAVLGLAFKAGTDDLRESPILDVMAELMTDGVKLRAHDGAITADTPIKQQLAYVENGASGLSVLADRLHQILHADAHDAIDGAEAVIVTHNVPEYRELLAGSKIPVIDVVQLFDNSAEPEDCSGIGW